MSVDTFIPTIWSENLLRSLDKKYIAVANCNREYEGDIKEKGSTVRIGGIFDVNVSDYRKNQNIGAPATLDSTMTDLVIEKAKYFNFQIDDVDRAQGTPHLMELAMKNAADALATEAEKYVYGLFDNAGYRAQEKVSVDNIIDVMLKARTHLYKNNACDPNEIVFEVSPEVAELILKAKLILSPNNNDPLEYGCIGSIAGCKIYVSNNIYEMQTENDGSFFQCYARTKRAIAFAEQLSEIEAYRPEQRFADAVKGLHLYGAKVIYPEEFAVMSLKVSN